MKKIIHVLIIFITIFALAITGYAENKVGEIVDYVLYTDIKTYINGTYIPSYNINNNTAIIAEHLSGFGFYVIWDPTNRTLSLKPNPRQTSLLTVVDPTTKSDYKIGDKILPVYYTDIKTYANDVQIPSYNIGGQTIVYVDDIAKYFGRDYVYDNEKRTLSLTLKGSILPEEDAKQKQNLLKEYIIKNGYNNGNLYTLTCNIPEVIAPNMLCISYNSLTDDISVKMRNERKSEYSQEIDCIETEIIINEKGKEKPFTYNVNVSGMAFSTNLNIVTITSSGKGFFNSELYGGFLSLSDIVSDDGSDTYAIMSYISDSITWSIKYASIYINKLNIDCTMEDFGFINLSKYDVNPNWF